MSSAESARNQPAHPAPELVIRPTSGWTRLELGELWRYRELTWFFTWRNIKARYRQMALGPLWIVIQPLVNAIVFSLVFGGLAQLPSEGIPYPLFTYAAMIPWTFFSSASVQSSGSLVNQMQVISKVYFPRLIVPVSAVLSGMVDLTFSLVILVAMMLFFGFVPGGTVLLLPAFVMLAAATALAVGLWTATLSVKFRDIKFAVTHGTRVWMFATPVAYSTDLVRESYESWLWLYRLNPMYWVIEGFRWSLLGQGDGPEPYMLIPVGLVLLALLSGAFVFRRTERTIVDLL